MSGLAQRMIWLTLALCLLTGCGGGQAGVTGQSRTPDQAWGQVLAFDGQFNESCFSDDYVDINLRASKDDIAAFELDLVNKTGSQILVRWDQVVLPVSVQVSKYETCACHYDRKCHEPTWCLGEVGVAEVCAAVKRRVARP